jgi:hypothetical protein
MGASMNRPIRKPVRSGKAMIWMLGVLALGATMSAPDGARAQTQAKRSADLSWYAQAGAAFTPDRKPRKLEAYLGGPVTLRGTIDESESYGASVVVGREIASIGDKPVLRLEAEARADAAVREHLTLGALSLRPDDRIVTGAALANVGLRLFQAGDTSAWVFGGAGVGFAHYPDLSAQTRCKCLSDALGLGIAFQAKGQLEHALSDRVSIYAQGAYLWLPRMKWSEAKPAFTRYERLSYPSASVGLRYVFRS